LEGSLFSKNFSNELASKIRKNLLLLDRMYAPNPKRMYVIKAFPNKPKGQRWGAGLVGVSEP